MFFFCLASENSFYQLNETFLNTHIQGSIEDYGSLIAAIKLVDVVISTISTDLTAEQFNIIMAIKELGNIKVQFI